MPRTKKAGGVPTLPASIRLLETKTIAHGSGFISFKEKSVVTDPWIIHAAIACGISHERLE